MSALEEMATGIAHELNQPSGAITTFAQAGRRMLERPEPMIQPAAEVVQHISDAALSAGEVSGAYAACSMATAITARPYRMNSAE